MDRNGEGEPEAIPAARIKRILEMLQEDERLTSLLGEQPLQALSVAVEGGALIVRPQPGVAVDDSEVQIVADCVEDAMQQVDEAGGDEGPASAAADTRRRGPNPHVIAARSHLDNGNPGRALEVAESAVERWSDNADLHMYRAIALGALGRKLEGIDAYKEVLRLQPESVVARTGIARLLGELDRWREALRHIEPGLELDQDNATLLHLFALAKESIGEYEQAEEALERALAGDEALPGADQDLQRIRAGRELDIQIGLETEKEADSEKSGEELQVELVEAAADEPSGTDEAEVAEGEVQQRQQADGRWGTPSPGDTEGAEILCDSCGRSNPEGAAFCIHCGHRIE